MSGEIHPEWDRDKYDEHEGLNQSTIKVAYDKSLYHAREEMLQIKEPTDALMDGQALHTLILEPELFDQRFAPMPVKENGDRHSRRTKAGLEAWQAYEEEHKDKWPLKPARIEELRLIRDQVLKQPTARELIEKATFKELSFTWDHPEHEFACKGQADLITEHDGWTYVIDLKSTTDASPRGFPRSVANYGYMVQHAWYLEGLNEVAAADRRYAFIAFEKTPPYAVCVHELDAELVFEGQHRCDTIARAWAMCLDDGNFTGYPNGINLLTGPRWAMTHERIYDDE